jgi:hypothetical protein
MQVQNRIIVEFTFKKKETLQYMNHERVLSGVNMVVIIVIKKKDHVIPIKKIKHGRNQQIISMSHKKNICKKDGILVEHKKKKNKSVFN